MAQSGYLLAHLIKFAILLRDKGLKITSEQLGTLALALEHLNLQDVDEVYTAGKLSLINRKEDIPLFAQLFESYFNLSFSKKPQQLETDKRGKLKRPPKERPLEVSLFQQLSPESQTNPDQETLVDKRFSYSVSERLKHKAFSKLSSSETQEIKKLMQRLLLKPPLRRSRRQMPSLKGHRLDLRRSFRYALKYQEFIKLYHRQAKNKLRPLIILADISGSMEVYSRLLLYFLHSLKGQILCQDQKFESFTFGTRLTRISHRLARRYPDDAIAAISDEVKDWAGGTRLASCLHDFNRRWSKRLGLNRALVLIISDGWDQDDPKRLSQEMARLHQNCYKLIWLNPLLGSANYQPLSRGMQLL
ncbi:MAG: VWA domain-containing protein [Deinococcales bacterium]